MEGSIVQRSSQENRIGLEGLPHTAAAVIYQCLDARSRTSLAAVCRWSRELVLREVTSVELQVHSMTSHKPLVRFINRVYSAADADRLSLSLETHGCAMKSNVSAPATQQGGWASVKHLTLKVFPGSADHRLSAEVVLSILTSCKQLTSLTLNYKMFDEDLNALLMHAPQLTSFTCNGLYLKEDRSASSCSWRDLVMKRQGLDAQTLACIPTASLTSLAFNNVVFPSSSPTLKFVPSGMSNPANMPEVVQRSLVNLTRCPAWQQCGPGVHVWLEFGELEYDINMPELRCLVPALASFVSKDVQLSVDMSDAAVRASEVKQLSAVLGSSLKQLVLRACKVSDDFWSVMWTHLPGLQQLTISSNVRGAIGVDELASFCSRATRPLQLNLGWYLYKRVEGKLDQEGRWRGVPQVTVTQV